MPERILEPDDLAFFRENGYAVVRNVLPRENLEAVKRATWEFLGMDPNDPEDWYRPPLTPGGMVEVYHHQSLWDNRQHPRMHQVYAELHGTQKLWVSIDRVCMKPPRHPAHPEYDHKGFIHWDCDSSDSALPFWVQGVLYLDDTTEDQGGFQCVPELFRDFPEWVKAQPVDRDPRRPDLTGYEITKIAGNAGDLIIWDRMLPHGNGHNISGRPRWAQFIAMNPAKEDDEALRQERIRLWRERKPMNHPAFPGDPRGIEANAKSAILTALGRKLLGLDRW